MPDALDLFHEPVRAWFRASFKTLTRAQRLGWPAIARGDSTLILAPTGTGKTLAAFLACLDRVMFDPGLPSSSAGQAVGGQLSGRSQRGTNRRGRARGATQD